MQKGGKLISKHAVSLVSILLIYTDLQTTKEKLLIYMKHQDMKQKPTLVQHFIFQFVLYLVLSKAFHPFIWSFKVSLGVLCSLKEYNILIEQQTYYLLHERRISSIISRHLVTISSSSTHATSNAAPRLKMLKW